MVCLLCLTFIRASGKGAPGEAFLLGIGAVLLVAAALLRPAWELLSPRIGLVALERQDFETCRDPWGNALRFDPRFGVRGTWYSLGPDGADDKGSHDDVLIRRDGTVGVYRHLPHLLAVVGAGTIAMAVLSCRLPRFRSNLGELVVSATLATPMAVWSGICAARFRRYLFMSYPRATRPDLDGLEWVYELVVYAEQHICVTSAWVVGLSCGAVFAMAVWACRRHRQAVDSDVACL